MVAKLGLSSPTYFLFNKKHLHFFCIWNFLEYGLSKFKKATWSRLCAIIVILFYFLIIIILIICGSDQTLQWNTGKWLVPETRWNCYPCWWCCELSSKKSFSSAVTCTEIYLHWPMWECEIGDLGIDKWLTYGKVITGFTASREAEIQPALWVLVGLIRQHWRVILFKGNTCRPTKTWTLQKSLQCWPVTSMSHQPNISPAEFT